MLLLNPLNSRIPRTNLIPIHLQPLHILLAQLKVKHLRVLLNPRRRNRFRQRNKALFVSLTISKRSVGKYLLQTPPNQHLRRRLAILPTQLFQNRLFSPLVPHNRTISLHDCPAEHQPANNIVPRKPRVQLVLSNLDLPAAAGGDITL